jgi:hypothetical protein
MLHKENVRNLCVTCGYVEQLPIAWAVMRIMKNLGGQIWKSASLKERKRC